MSGRKAPTAESECPDAARDGVDLEVVERVVEEHGRHPGAVIPILHGLQDHFRWLPPEALEHVCSITDITPSRIEGVSTFYSHFRHRPVGDHVISVCHGTACHVAGAPAVTESLKGYLGIGPDEDTDESGTFTIEGVACIGCCSLAPVLRIDDRIYGHLSRRTAPRAVEEFLRSDGQESEDGEDLVRRLEGSATGEAPVEVRIGMDTYSLASGSDDVARELCRVMREEGRDATVRSVGSVGMYHFVPMVEFHGPDGRARYGNVTPSDVPKLARRHAHPDGFWSRARAALRQVARLVTDDTAWEPPGSVSADRSNPAVRSFLDRQKHIVLEAANEMDPLNIDDYESHGGYEALRSCVSEMEPGEVIDTVSRSGLRGRGGGGYPTGTKWHHVRNEPGEVTYVVLNGDEGDPGAFMDRMLMESCPHRVLEGVAIAAYAVGAREAYLYVRHEYPLALHRLRKAIEQAEDRGYLGSGICGSDRELEINVMEGAGAFVCGEETALTASLEGKRGMPRFRPPYPAQSGLWGKPTLINNVETYATVPWILRHGADEFSKIGTESSRGTKVFALAGRIRRGGLIEVPMGITIGDIVDDIGGGIQNDRQFKAVQIGGPSGGCLPASLRDVRIDYRDLQEHGAIMGSGGLVVLDEDTCMVDVARYFLEFTQQESCGKCTSCRIGTKRMLEILERLCTGEARSGDVQKLEDLCHDVRDMSLCGLGSTAPNPVLTTLRYFRNEYEAHLEGRCPARSCTALIRYRITDECIGCTLCAQSCPSNAIPMRPYEKHEIIDEDCVRCGTCRAVCPEDAVEVD